MSYSGFLRSREGRITASPIGKIVRAAGGVSAMAIAGQLILVATIPILARLYSPADFGLGLLAFGLLMFWKCPPWLVVILTALGGEVMARF